MVRSTRSFLVALHDLNLFYRLLDKRFLPFVVVRAFRFPLHRSLHLSEMVMDMIL